MHCLNNDLKPFTADSLSAVKGVPRIHSGWIQLASLAAAVMVAALSLVGFSAAAQTVSPKAAPADSVPAYQFDPTWPKPLPNQWVMGAVCGVAIDKHGNIWIVQRPLDLAPADRAARARGGAAASAAATPVPPASSATAVPVPSAAPVRSPNAAPPVLEFSLDGTVISSWGGPGEGYEWPKEEHGIYVDLHDNVWVGGAGNDDNQILKFTNKGKFILQIGHAGKNRGSNDTENLGGPAAMFIDEPANEIYVADGYVNHRIIVFNATTGAYKRHWGAYGKRPDDSYYEKLGVKLGEHTSQGVRKPVPSGPPSPQFDLVHGIRISEDGLVYVCDRTNNRIQVFHKDGTFVKEAFIDNTILASGTTSDIGFSSDPQQRYAFVGDATYQHVYILDRQSLTVLGRFGESGKLPGQIGTAHNMAVDSKNDIYITESHGSRVQRFIPVDTKESK